MEESLRYQSSGTVSGFEANPWLEWHPDWLIVGSDGSGSHLLYDPIGVWEGHSGQLIQWVHGDFNYVKYSSIYAWLVVLVGMLATATLNEEGEVEIEPFIWQQLMARLDPSYPKDPIEPN